MADHSRPLRRGHSVAAPRRTPIVFAEQVVRLHLLEGGDRRDVQPLASRASKAPDPLRACVYAQSAHEHTHPSFAPPNQTGRVQLSTLALTSNLDEGNSVSSDDQDDLDFERAEFEAPEGQTDQADPGSASTGPAGIGCVACGRAIHDAYFTRNNQFVCTSCEAPVRAAGPPGSGITRFLGALGLGLVAAAAASVLWVVVTEFTGYEIGLIAIAVGWIVGVAITMGSRGTGGWPYQIMAVVLTYTAIVFTYVPMVAPAIEQQWLEEQASIVVSGEASEDVMNDPLAAIEEADRRAEDPGINKPIIYATAIAVSFTIPFLGGFENLIGLLIIGFGLYQAFKMTAKREIMWGGPFRIGTDIGPAR